MTMSEKAIDQLKLHQVGIVKYREIPMYEYTAASADCPRKATVIELVCFPCGDRFHQA
jgi:hypothetical protein